MRDKHVCVERGWFFFYFNQTSAVLLITFHLNFIPSTFLLSAPSLPSSPFLHHIFTSHRPPAPSSHQYSAAVTEDWLQVDEEATIHLLAPWQHKSNSKTLKLFDSRMLTLLSQHSQISNRFFFYYWLQDWIIWGMLSCCQSASRSFMLTLKLQNWICVLFHAPTESLLICDLLIFTLAPQSGRKWNMAGLLPQQTQRMMQSTARN